MRAVLVKDGSLLLGETNTPEPKHDEVRIEIHAAGVNRADLLQRRGIYPPPPGVTPILGLECSGVVRDVGFGVTRFRVGDQVMALLAGGGYAEEVCVDEGSVMPLPRGWTFAQGAACPEAFITAYLNMVELGGAQSGERVLVQGGSGGVGTAAIQLGKHFGFDVAVTAGSPERCARCLQLGASLAIDHRASHFATEIQKAWGRVHLIVDCIGAPYLADHLRILGDDGRLVLIGLQGGHVVSETSIAPLLSKRVSVRGSTLRSLSAQTKRGIVGRFLEQTARAFQQKQMLPVIDRVEPWERCDAIHEALRRGEIFGKAVLEVRPRTLDQLRSSGS